MSEDYNCSQETIIVHGVTPYDSRTGAISTPIYLSSTFRHPELFQSTGFDYSRSLNPTRLELENTIARLEKGRYGLAFASGMSAISALIKLFAPGDHIIVSIDLYGGTYRLFHDIYEPYGLHFSWVDTDDLEATKNALRPGTKAVFIETPSNPMMKVTDIRATADIIHSHGQKHGQEGYLIVDNTFLSPYYQNPLELGADFVVHSGTKYISGHNDTLSGFIVHDDETIAEKLRFLQMSEGGTLSPFESWLILRGLKTLAVRMDRQSENALVVAMWLQTHPKVESVYYVGLPDHPHHELSLRQSKGFGGMVSFSLKDSADVASLLKNIRLILFAESLGGVETLLTYPMVQTHQAIPPDMRERTGVTDRLMRLSVGLERAQDIIADLKQALD
ncbi:trans-sulfuration enzyme family protein [Parasphaerochaeta coccoides]|uniref:Cystathionine gamma-lyase n=1 Tax=Parasphaerochaeta coccoides (strain ATCC BAA-1237 / DSM 17374 / SPN1) TaxID=760011 RepID=F4GHJ5_PARC1|nr:PLP-dependent aspartate aminotransferase family protein [Parasphaerochaeta coccoides]AEC02584.1 Cystathionine gamma-lyase [Parasphaerochaeta coccoides DSM 17374]